MSRKAAMAMAISQHDAACIALDGVSREAYAKILDSLRQRRLGQTYGNGTLTLPALLENVCWEEYEALLDALPEHYLRHTYDRGTLELMSPSQSHEWLKTFIGRMIEAAAQVLHTPIKCVGSTTWRRRSAQRGLEPDESYYIANERVVRDKWEIDLKRDPPPDLVVEVDVTSSSLDRLKVYASLAVPEIWRHDGRTLTFLRLTKSRRYEPIVHSLSFPFIQPADVMRYLDQLGKKDEVTLLDAFMKWVRRRAKPGSSKRGGRPRK